jgi:hypothetical protein
MASENGFSEYKQLILASMQEQAEFRKEMEKRFDSLHTEFVELKTEAKAAKWFGGIALPAVISIGVSWLGRKLGG